MRFWAVLISGAALPGSAWAEVCDTERPVWDGTPATQLSEALGLISSPIGLFLLGALTIAVVFRHPMGTALAALMWSCFIAFLVLPDTSGVRAQAMAEGCVAPPTLFIGLSTAICALAVVYTFRRETRL